MTTTIQSLSCGNRSNTKPPVAENKNLPIWLKLAISIFLAGQAMVLSLAVNLSNTSTTSRLTIHIITLSLTLVVMGLLGPPLVLSAIADLKQKRITVQALFLTTMFGAMIASLQSMISGEGAVYFEVVSVLLVIYTVNILVKGRNKASAIQAAETWINRLRSARKIDDRGHAAQVSIDEIVAGDLVEVNPGEWIPIDGEVVQGTAFVCDTPMTGEPFARVVRPGDRVLAGYSIEDATLRIRSTANGSNRKIDDLLTIIDNARKQPSSIQSIVDRLTQLFLPIILSISILTFTGWTYLSGWQVGLFRAMSVLLIACPCALGLATPIAIWTTLGQFAQRGLVVRHANVIERLASVNQAIFDKTGTLTSENLYLVDVVTRPGGIPRQRLLSWLAEIEARSSHPIAKALSNVEVSRKEKIFDVHVQVVPGCGLQGYFLDIGGSKHTFRVGQPDWFPKYDNLVQNLLDNLRDSNGRQVYLEIDGNLEAICVLKEKLRENVNQSLLQLSQMDISVSVFTGDIGERTKSLGISEFHTNLSPTDKVTLLQHRQKEGNICLFVGDGINDAPVLSVAPVSIALASGTDLAIAAAPATLYNSDLRLIPWAISVSRRAVRVIRGNLIWAASFNLVGITVACLGYLHPIFAALLMVCSSLFVCWRSAELNHKELSHSSFDGK